MTRSRQDAATASVRILHLEDDPADSRIVRSLLDEGELECEIVQVKNRAAYLAALAESHFDVILADFWVSDLDGFEALDAARERAPETPFVYVSSSIGEEKAVEALRRGATDYVIKQDLDRLVPVVERAIREAAERDRRREAERAAEQTERRFRALIENNFDVILLVDRDRKILYASPSIKRVLGYEPESLYDRTVDEHVAAEDHDRLLSLFESIEVDEPTATFDQIQFLRQDGFPCWTDGSLQNLLDEPGVNAIVANFRDVTNLRRRERERTATMRVSHALRAATTRAEMAPVILEQTAHLVDANGAALCLVEKDRVVFLLGWGSWSFTTGKSAAADSLLLRRLFPSGGPFTFRRTIVGEPRAQTEEFTFPESLLTEDTVAGAPLVVEGSVIGALLFGKRERLADGDLRLLTSIADMAAMAIHRTALHEETKRRADEFASLYELVKDLTLQRDLAQLLRTAVDRAIGLLGASLGAIFIYDEQSSNLVLTVARGFTPADNVRFKVGEGAIGRVAELRLPVIVNESPELDVASRLNGTDDVEMLPLRAYVAVPMLYSGSLIGVLGVAEVEPNERTFDDSDLRLLGLFAAQAASAAHSARLFEEATQRLERVQALHAIDNAITSGVPVKIVCGILLDQALAQLRVDAASVLLVNHARNTLEFFEGRGFQTNTIERSSVRVGEGAAGVAAAERRIVSIDRIDESNGDFVRGTLARDERFVTYAAVPIESKGTLRGILEVYTRRPSEMGAEAIDFFSTLAGQAAVALDNAELLAGLQRSNAELVQAYDATIEGWSHALDLRDKETEGHTQRVTEYTQRLARAMGINDADLVQIRRGALLHDIGKMGVPDSILLKPGPLTDEEWERMRMHPGYAYEMLHPIVFLRPALDIPYCHHEKWDGTGYPRGLRGEQIPLAARIFSVIDVWDALSSDRPYRKGWPREKVLAHIQSLSGTQFDPRVVEEFLKLASKEE